MSTTSAQPEIRIPVVLFGGGVAGLWLLDELRRRGVAALLLEAHQLGRGQTVASQGILHGGLKYTLQGLLTKSARKIRDLPGVWRDCLAGNRQPRLGNTVVRSPHCYLWRTESITSRLGMIGAKVGLRVAPESLSQQDRPAVLANCPGTVARLDEQVIAPASLIADLANRHTDRILKIDAANGLEFVCNSPGRVTGIVLRQGKRILSICPDAVVFTAGAGNGRLRSAVGLSADAMQRRPLHMVMLRGDLPALNGHCVDGRKTRVTVTSDRDSGGRTVWQVGGQISEDGVTREPAELIARARDELQTVIPGLDLSGVEWSTYRVDRAEGRIPGNRRPETCHVQTEGNVSTVWPTKLVLAPRVAEMMADKLGDPSEFPEDWKSLSADWPKPTVALPTWETAPNWYRDDGSIVSRTDAA